jgi:hypothetical protein
MKLIKSLSIALLLLNFNTAFAQKDSIQNMKNNFQNDKLTIEPAIGTKPTVMTALMASNVLQWNIKKRISIVSHTSYTWNQAFLPEFNYIKTNYNYSLSQKFGVGTSFFTKHFCHTFSLMAGINYDAFKETMDNPEFKKVTVSQSSMSPDFGLMYNMKVGNKKYFFSYRMFIPIYPFPFKSSDINSVEGNLANLTLEFGLGIRLK